MRRKESKRKDERTRREEKKATERAAAEAETRRLMALKRDEVRHPEQAALASCPVHDPVTRRLTRLRHAITRLQVRSRMNVVKNVAGTGVDEHKLSKLLAGECPCMMVVHDACQ